MVVYVWFYPTLMYYHDPAVFETRITSVHLSLITVTVREIASSAHGAAGGWKRFSPPHTRTHNIPYTSAYICKTTWITHHNTGVILSLYFSRFLRSSVSARTEFLITLTSFYSKVPGSFIINVHNYQTITLHCCAYSLHYACSFNHSVCTVFLRSG